MAGTNQPDEVQVLRFFDTALVEKVEAVFNIVFEKLRQRQQERSGQNPDPPAIIRRRRSRPAARASSENDRQEQTETL
jgi:hypothetical protein